MNKLWIILAVLVVVGGCDAKGSWVWVPESANPRVMLALANPENQDIRILKHNHEALEARVKTLEDWAVRQGGKFK